MKMQRQLIAGTAGVATLLVSSMWVVARDQAQPAPSLAEMKQQADALLQQTQLLRDEKDIEKLQRKFGYYYDKKLWDQAAALFTDDATYEPGHTGIYVGKASIRGSFDQFGPQGIKDGELFNHMQLQGIVHVAEDGNTANGRWRSLVQLGEFGKNAFWREGVYENEYSKRNGVWQIQKVHFFPNFTTPYEKGWAKEVLAEATVAPQGFETDKPPSLQYQAFPKYFVPPFHYNNPVTGQPPLIGKSKETGDEK